MTSKFAVGQLNNCESRFELVRLYRIESELATINSSSLQVFIFGCLIGLDLLVGFFFGGLFHGMRSKIVATVEEL